MFGKGIDKIGDLVSIASDLGVITKSGSWFSYGEVRLGQGKERAVEFLSADPAMMAEVRSLTMSALAGGGKSKVFGESDEEELEVMEA